MVQANISLLAPKEKQFISGLYNAANTYVDPACVGEFLPDLPDHEVQAFKDVNPVLFELQNVPDAPCVDAPISVYRVEALLNSVKQQVKRRLSDQGMNRPQRYFRFRRAARFIDDRYIDVLYKAEMASRHTPLDDPCKQASTFVG